MQLQKHRLREKELSRFCAKLANLTLRYVDLVMLKGDNRLLYTIINAVKIRCWYYFYADA